MKKIIHINQHVVKSNKKNNEDYPVITVKTYKSNSYGNKVLLKDDNGKVIAKIIYDRSSPLKCGATCWIETDLDVEVMDYTNELIQSV